MPTQTGTEQEDRKQEQMETSEEPWRKEVQHLREALAEKEEQISKAVKRRRQRTVAHLDTLALLTVTQLELKESRLKCASLEETLRRQKPEKPKRAEPRGTKTEFEFLVMEKEFNAEKKAMMQQLRLQEQKFKNLLDEEQRKYNEKMSEKDVSMKQQLLDKEEHLKKMLADVSTAWMTRGQAWVLKQEELDRVLEENQKIRQQEEDKRKEEIQRLSAEILHLQLQAQKKKEKSCWRWKFWKKKQ